MEDGNGIKKGSPKHFVESPLADEEIMKDEAPMLEKDNPALTSNGSGQPFSKKDEDNGWIVPIDELKKSEKPDVEDTKL